MTLLTWNNTCTVGVRAMDDQHGILLDALNDLRQALLHGAGREQLAEKMNCIVEFTRMHFNSEEQLLDQTGYPELEEHREAHRRLLREIGDAAQHALLTEGLEMTSLLGFLRHWYLEHIETLDRRYGTWLNDHGIF